SAVDIPITLGGPQTWTIDDALAVFNGQIDGNQSLTLNFHGGAIAPYSEIEVGDLTVGGVGVLYLDGDTAGNATDGSPVAVANGAGIEADQTANNVGPLTVGRDGFVSVGGVDDGGGQLAVNGAMTLTDSAELDLAVDAPGTNAGRDYSQIKAS